MTIPIFEINIFLWSIGILYLGIVGALTNYSDKESKKDSVNRLINMSVYIISVNIFINFIWIVERLLS